MDASIDPKKGPRNGKTIPKLDVDWLITGCGSNRGNDGISVSPECGSKFGASFNGQDNSLSPMTQHLTQPTRDSELTGKDGEILRRTQSLNTDSRGHTEGACFKKKKKKLGFFERVFGRRKSAKKGCDNRELQLSCYECEKTGNGGKQQKAPWSGWSNPTSPGSSAGQDVKLQEFLNYYGTVGFSNFRHVDDKDMCLPDKTNESQAKEDEASTNESLVTRTVILDKLNRPIPPHPDKPNLAPALRRTRRRGSFSVASKTKHESTGGKVGAFLRKVTSNSTEILANTLTSSDSEKDEFNQNRAGPCKYSTIPGLEDLKALRRVTFAKNTYFNNPPQQICSRNPRVGEVEIKEDGSVVIHRLTAEEKRLILQHSCTGIVVGGSRCLKSNDDETVDRSLEGKEGYPSRRRASPPPPTIDPHNEVERHSESARAIEDAEVTAEIPAKSDSSYIKNGNLDEDLALSSKMSSITIDKQSLPERSMSVSSLSSAETYESDVTNTAEILPPFDPQIPNHILYTRCCYLREILPIPAIMKQIKKDSTDPIPLLQLRNPKPSTVEILSFTDFLSVAPILCVSLDGVSLSVDMFRIILSSLVNSATLEKLSLRNTPIDDEGWKFLADFIAKSKHLRAIDLTMVPNIPTNVQKLSKSSRHCTIPRMVCDMNGRADRNWDLFTASVAINSHMEDMLLSGAKFSLEQFKHFIKIGCVAAERLGLAYNLLSKEHISTLSIWLTGGKASGLDLGFNDLNGKLRPLADALLSKSKNSEKNTISCLSLNSSNLKILKGSTSQTNEVLSLLDAFRYCESLSFIDFSNNPDMFTYGIAPLINYLPVLTNLTRLQLNYNNFTRQDLISLAEVLPLCTSLNYLSIVGSKLDIPSSSAFASAVELSSSMFTLEADYDNIPERIRQKISLYSIRNMERAMHTNETDNGSGLQKELTALLTEKISDNDNYSMLVSKFSDKVHKTRLRFQKVIEGLFSLRIRGELNIEGKESLIRLCFLDASLERGLNLLSSRYQRSPTNHAGPTDFSNATPPEFEAIKQTNSVASISSLSLQESGHAALLPFHQPSINTYDPADETIELRTNFNVRNRHADKQREEEGRVLKKTQEILKELRGTDDCNLAFNSETLKDIIEQVSCDQIKNFLLSHDISQIMELLDALQHHGVEINDIFKKASSDSSPDSTIHENNFDEVSPPNTLPKRNSILETKNHTIHDKDNDINETEIMDHVYDVVLDRLEKTRTNRDGD
ncbi:HHL031Cp [Eremothecium sinecaudum]|uniref:HHL031Cp n=1 Tax=Eremothecium sinecaudum TaxID=45286 RepID=A0A0X8HWC8_9SACH|nr:HHL031Cp [Eremothecium sinecaudum]AMD22739.1 HHL031Cp [Eremothecium sinecaudum]